MEEKIRLQDIAEMAGVSRNTVSKILNGRYTGSPKVKEQVLGLIREHNYKGMAQMAGMPEKVEVKTILLLCREGVPASAFFPHVINEIQGGMEGRGYVLQFYSITQEEEERGHIPAVITKHQIDGIACIEILDKLYIQKLVAHQIPLVFFEFCSDMWSIPGWYDIVMVNNEFPAYKLTKHLLDRGCRNIGFVGDYAHCRGFYERYQGYCRALAEGGIPVDPHSCITYADKKGYEPTELWKSLRRMERMPDAFVAANDSIGIFLMQALGGHGYRIPEDVRIAGFDNIAEAAAMQPPLATVNSHRKAVSKNMMECLQQRMENPKKPKRVVYVDSEIIYRESLGS